MKTTKTIGSAGQRAAIVITLAAYATAIVLLVSRSCGAYGHSGQTQNPGIEICCQNTQK